MKFARKNEGRGVDLLDLIGAANQGLMRAIQKFRSSRN